MSDAIEKQMEMDEINLIKFSSSISNSDINNKIFNIGINAFAIGNFRLYLKVFQGFPNLFYDLGTNEYHDHLLNMITACVLINERNKEIFKSIQLESLWDTRVYEL